jgi:hypothetical protein
MEMESHSKVDPSQARVVMLPASTAWPMALALGVSLGLAGMVTNVAISLLGLVIAVAGMVGWFRQVLPIAQHESVAADAGALTAGVASPSVEPSPAGPIHRETPHRETLHREIVPHRKIIPVETYTITAGIKGGIAGGIAMSIPAVLFGLIKYHSVWYAINLLAAGGFVGWADQSNAFLGEFHLRGLLAAIAIHATASLLVGLLYGAMLPMYPKRPILTAGFIAPFLWTGLVYSILGVVSPILDQRIDWLWFTISQCAFGLVAGFVVNLDVKVRTPQFQALPFATRAGLHGDFRKKSEKEDSLE